MTQTVERISIPSEREHRQSHDPAAVCFLCAEGPAWWADVRRKKGLDGPVYERPARQIIRHHCQPRRSLRHHPAYVPGAGFTGR